MTAALHIDDAGVVCLYPKELIGQRIAVLGMSGAGKSNTTAVLCEEMLLHTPASIIDPEGEMFGLKERFSNILITGRGERVDLPIHPMQAGAVCEFAWARGLTVILDTSEFDADETDLLLVMYLKRLWELADRDRKPHLLVIEEAEMFIPQSGATELSKLIYRVAKRGRKRGTGMIIASQRAAKVSKDVLTQCGYYFLHRVAFPNELAVYKDLLPIKAREVDEVIPALKPGQAYFRSQDSILPVQVRLRHTFHGGSTPGLDAAQPPTFEPISPEIMAALREALGKPADEPTEDVHALQLDNARLQKRIAELEAEIASLRVAGQAVQLAELVTPAAADQATAVPSGEAADTPVVTASANGHGKPLERAVKMQERKFARFMNDLRGQPKYHQVLLAYLVRHEKDEFALGDLCHKIGYERITLSRNPPTRLISEGLVDRRIELGEHYYKSDPRWVLRERYPDLGVDALMECLRRLVEL